MKQLSFEKQDEHIYSATAYPLDESPGFYSEYRALLVGGRWMWRLVSITWDDEDQTTECVEAESRRYFDLFLSATADAQKHFEAGNVHQ